MTCRYCELELATTDHLATTPEGGGKTLCWSEFGEPCLDAEEALDIARTRIAEMEKALAEARTSQSKEVDRDE